MKRAHLGVRIAVFAVTMMSFASCSDDGPTGLQRSELQRAEQRWLANGPPKGRYTMLQQRICFCGDYMITYEVTVIGGVPTRILSPTGLEMPQTMFASFRTVEQMFVELRAGLSTGAVREVAYDAETGYPAVVSLDPVRNATDDEVIYRTSHITPIP